MKRLFTVMLFVLVCVAVVSAQADQRVFTYQVGDFTIYLLSDNQTAGNQKALVGATPEMIEKTIPSGDYPSAVNTFLVNTGKSTVLVDAGYGTELFNNMKSVGVTPDKVDAVLLTHLHGDHIGGMLVDGKPAFPHAKVYISVPEHDYWLTQSGGAKRMIEAYKDRIRLFYPQDIEAVSSQLLDGITGIALFGHTPGHTGYLVDSKGEKLFIWGDIAHAMDIQMPYPQVATVWDVDTEQAIKTRARVLTYVSQHQLTVTGAHICYPAIGTLKSNATTGYFFNPVK